MPVFFTTASRWRSSAAAAGNQPLEFKTLVAVFAKNKEAIKCFPDCLSRLGCLRMPVVRLGKMQVLLRLSFPLSNKQFCGNVDVPSDSFNNCSCRFVSYI